MKGLVLDVVSVAFLIGWCSVGLRLYHGDREYKIFISSLLCAIAFYLVLFLASPVNLGFLPPYVLEANGSVDLVNGMIVLVAVFAGFWAFSYAACIGPTMTTLVELRRRRDEGMLLREITILFGEGKPMSDFLRRRLPKLVDSGYVVKTREAYELQSRGKMLVRVLILLRSLLGVEVG